MQSHAATTHDKNSPDDASQNITQAAVKEKNFVDDKHTALINNTLGDTVFGTVNRALCSHQSLTG